MVHSIEPASLDSIFPFPVLERVSLFLFSPVRIRKEPMMNPSTACFDLPPKQNKS